MELDRIFLGAIWVNNWMEHCSDRVISNENFLLNFLYCWILFVCSFSLFAFVLWWEIFQSKKNTEMRMMPVQVKIVEMNYTSCSFMKIQEIFSVEKIFKKPIDLNPVRSDHWSILWTRKKILFVKYWQLFFVVKHTRS